jgi:hypothetical protein
LRIDILNEVDGVSFAVAWQNKREVVYEGVEINFIGFKTAFRQIARFNRH